jgi:hypothetical protein
MMRCQRSMVVLVLCSLLTACATEDELDGEDLEASELEAELVTCPVTIDRNRELMITHLAVVNDTVRTRWTGSTTSTSDGAWHFGRLMTSMAGTVDPSDFVRRWLQIWEADRFVNTELVRERDVGMTRLLASWPRRLDGKLDLTRAPLRLLAIVNRIDLRNLAAGSAGEGRFVFGVLENGVATQFTVILEYKLPATTQADVLRWAEDWHNLSTLTLGSAAYRDALEKITNRFAARGAAPTRPNGSAISQVRTNEISLDAPWELREFTLPPTGGILRQTPVVRTPMGKLNNSTLLATFINTRRSSILAGSYTVPTLFNDVRFQGGAIANNIDFWNAPGITDARARHLFSLNTCNGCHGAETSTGFLHVFPREAGSAAQLSGFLKGVTVADPVTGTSRTFNDLSRRANDLKALLCPTTAARALALEPLERTH